MMLFRKIYLFCIFAQSQRQTRIFKYSINSTDNYPSDGDRFYNALYPNNKNIATKGIDYNFWNTVEMDCEKLFVNITELNRIKKIITELKNLS